MYKSNQGMTQKRGNAISNFCKSLVSGFRQSGSTQEQNEAATADALHGRRVVKQGNFDWGSFSAFEDGSIEVERDGVKQWFRTFSELKCSLSRKAENRSIVGGHTIDA
jgi:hypothetical protein